MLNNNTTNNTTSRKRMVVVAAVLALLFLCGVSRALYLSAANEYQMVLNGDAEVEILQNTEYTDDGVTFYEEGFFGGKKPVSTATQARLEEELEITGLDTLDVSVCGDNTIEYRYDDQMLQRLVKVVTGGQQSPDDNPEQTGKPNGETTPGGETGKPGDTQQTENPGGDGSNGDQNTGNTEPGDKVYHLPSNVTYNNAYFVYDGNNHTMTVRNLPDGIIPVYTGNTNIWAGTYDTKVEFVLSEAMQRTYSSVEPAFLTAKMTIRQATPQYEVPTNLTATVGQTLRDVKSQLPKGFSFEAPLKTSVGAEGVNVFKVTFTPDDTDNYKTVTGINVQITVSGKSGESSEKVPYHLPSFVTFDNVTRTYSGYSNSIYVQNLPTGIIPVYTGNAQTNAGTYEVTVTFMLSDELKKTCSSVEPASMTATLTILKATPKYTVPENLTATEGDTLRSVKLPKGFSFQDPLTTSVGTVGTHVFKVTFTPEDTRNYETVTDIEVLLRVKPKSGGGGGNTDPEPDHRTTYYLPSDVKYEDLTVTYNGKEWVLVVKGVPAGINVSYLNNKGTNAGTYEATAVFELSASMLKKYSSVSPSTMTATLRIDPATPTGFKVPTGLEATENTTLSNVSLGDTHFRWKTPSENVGAASNTPKAFTAIYTPSDKNYAAVEVTVYVKVKASNPDPGPGPGPGPVTKETPKLIGGKTEFTFEEGKVDIDTILAGWKAIDSNNHEVPGTFEVKKVGDKYTVVFTPSNPDRYTTASKDVAVTEKAPTPPAKETPIISGNTSITLNKGDDVNSILSGFTAKDKDGNTIAGTFTITGGTDGKYTVTFTPNDPSKYSTANTDVTITFKEPVDPPPAKETPIINGNTSITLNKGDDVNSILSGFTAKDKDGNTIAGTFTITEGTGGKYTVTFTPDDPSKYNTADTNVTITFKDPPKPPEKETPTVTAPNGNTSFTVYKGESVDDIISGWQADIPGTFTVKENTDGSYVVVFTPQDTSKYKPVETSVTVDFQPTTDRPTDGGNDGETDTPKTPTVTAPNGNTSFTVYKGESVGDIISGWQADIPGTFTVKENTDGSYVVVFTPEDTSKYNPVETSVTVDFQPATDRPTGGGNEDETGKLTTPTVTVPNGNTSFTVYKGETPENIVTGWTSDIPGKFSVKENADGSYAVVFTPEDTSKYETVETNVTVDFQPTTDRPTDVTGSGGSSPDEEGDGETSTTPTKVTPAVTSPNGDTSFTLGDGKTVEDIITGWTATDEAGNVISGSFTISENDDGETVVVFTPDEPEKYDVVKTEISIETNPTSRPNGDTTDSEQETETETTAPFVPTPAPVTPSTNNVDGVETGTPTTTVTETQVENGVTEGTPEIPGTPEAEQPAEGEQKKEEEEEGEREEAGKKDEGEKPEGEGTPEGEELGEPAEGELDGEAA